MGLRQDIAACAALYNVYLTVEETLWFEGKVIKLNQSSATSWRPCFSPPTASQALLTQKVLGIHSTYAS